MGRISDTFYNKATKKNEVANQETGRIRKTFANGFAKTPATIGTGGTTSPVMGEVAIPSAALVQLPVTGTSYTYEQTRTNYNSSVAGANKAADEFTSLLAGYGATTDNIIDVLIRKHGGTVGKDGTVLFKDEASLNAYRADADKVTSGYKTYETAAGAAEQWSKLFDGYDRKSELERLTAKEKADKQEWERLQALANPRFYPSAQTVQAAKDAKAKWQATTREKNVLLGDMESERGDIEYRRILNLDTGAAQEEIAMLDQQIAAKTDRMNQQTAGLDLEGAGATKREIDELEQRKAAVGRDLTLQERYQKKSLDGKLYAQLVDKPDFEKYAKVGATRDNTGAMPQNIVHYYRENGHPLYSTMTQAEVDTYDYLLGKEGEASAQAYLEHMHEELNRRQGVKEAQEIKQIKDPMLRAAATGWYGLKSGVHGAGQGMVQSFVDKQLVTSKNQFGSQELMKDMSGSGKLLYSAINTIGNMAPSILVSAVTGVPVAGTALMGLSAAGNAYNQALEEGHDPGKARAYSLLVGASEATLQYALGGISKLGSDLVPKALSRVAAIDKIYKNAAGAFVMSLGQEVVEEELQLFLEPMLQELILNVPYDAPNFAEIAETAIVTLLSTGMMEGTGPAVGTVLGKGAQAVGSGVQKLRQGKLTPPTSKTVQAILDASIQKAQGGEDVRYLPAPMGEDAALTTQRPAEDDVRPLPKAEDIENAASGTETAGAVGELQTAVQAAVDEAKNQGGVSSRTADTLIGDNNALRELGIDTNGKTKAQLREEVRMKVLELARQDDAPGLPAPVVEGDRAVDTEEDDVRPLPTAEEIENRSAADPQEQGTSETVRTRDEVEAELNAAKEELRQAEYALEYAEGESVHYAIERVNEAEAKVKRLENELQHSQPAVGDDVRPLPKAEDIENADSGTETAAEEDVPGLALPETEEDGAKDTDPADAIPDEDVALPLVPTSDPKVQREWNRAAKIAHNFGCRLVVGVPEGGGEGSYLNGVITINPNCKNPVMQVLLHELTHRLENSRLYGKLTLFARNWLDGHGVDVDARIREIIEEREAQGYSLSERGAMQEVVAQFVQEHLFRNEQAIRRLLREDRTLWQKIRNWLQDAVRWVRKAGGLFDDLYRAERLFEKALRGSDPKMGMSEAQHLYAGEGAITADQRALSQANQMERDGADTEDIRKTTGWFRGMDGKWRFEIDDSGMSYHRGGDSKFRLAHPEYREYQDLLDKMLTADITEAEHARLRQLEDIWGREYGRLSDRVDRGNARLEDLIDHPALFEAYPVLRFARVVFDTMAGNKGASYDPKTNTITVNENMRNAPERELLHEIQHAIQEMEGFAGGSNRDYWENRVERGYSRRWSDSGREMMPGDLYRNTAGEIEARDAANRRGLDEAARRLKEPDLGDEDTVFADGVVSFNADNVPFRKQIDDVLDGKANAETTHLNMGNTPNIYGEFGLRTDVPILVTANHVKNMNAKVDTGTGTPHAMTRGQIASIPKKMADPVMVMVSKSYPDRLVVVTDIVDNKKRPVIVILQPDGRGNYMSAEIDANIAASGYGKDGFRNYVISAFSDGRMLWCDYKKSHQLQQTPGVQFPNNLPHGDFSTNIARYAARVKKNRVTHSDRYDSMDDVPADDVRPLPRAEDLEKTTPQAAAQTESIAEEPDAAVEDPAEQLPTKAREYLKRVERRLVARISGALSVPFGAQREFLRPVVEFITREVMQTGRVSQETLDGLFDTAYDAGIVVDEEYYNDYKFIRQHLRKTALTLSKVDQADIADFGDFRKSIFGLLTLKNEGGLPVDVAYMELRSMAPDLFPEDITHPADQLVHIAEVVKGIEKAEKTLDDYYGPEAEEFKAWAKRDFEGAVSDMLGELRTVARYAQEQTAKKAEKLTHSPEDVRKAFDEIRAARKSKEKAVARNLLTEHDTVLVGRLLKGEITLEDIDPAKANVSGIREVFEASQEYERLSRVIREYNRLRKAKLYEQVDKFLETANQWKDKRAGFWYSRETMERNIRDIVPDRSVAQSVIDFFFAPIHKAEAASTRFKNSYREQVKALNLSRKVAEGNEVSEAYAVQFIGEAQDNIRVLQESKGRMKSRDGKTLKDWQAEIADLWANNPGLDRAKIEGAVKEFRSIYDELFQQMNEVRLRNGYEPVAYRQGYFPHFQSTGEGGMLAAFGKALGIDTSVGALPTTINGLTHTFRPGITWMANAQERQGFATVYDAVEGFDKYINGAADVIHHTDNIQRLRALADRIRYRTGDKGIREQLDALKERKDLTEQEKEVLRKDIHEKGKYTLSRFVVELEEYTNLLANKKSIHDRNAEHDFGRKVYQVVKGVMGRVAANMVALNPGSWLTNFIPITQAWGTVSSGEILQAMWDTLRSYKADDGLVERSAFLTNRRGSDPLVRSWSEQASETLSKPMEWIDAFTSDVVVRAKYLQNLRRGMSEELALSDADAFAAGVIADRSKGATPTLFRRSNPVTKLLTQFQLEVNNQFSHLAKDIPDELKEKALGALAAALLKFFLGAFLYNEVYEFFIGRRPALDPIGILNDTVGDLSGWELPNLVELGTGAVTGDMPSFRTERKGVYGAGLALGTNVAEELPFIGGLLGGGRVPISSALPDPAKLWSAATNTEWSGKKRVETGLKEVAKPLLYTLPPFGGGQLKKTVEGIGAAVQGGSYSVDSKTGKGVLQYPVYNDAPGEMAGALVKGAVFGKSSLKTAQEWVEDGFDSYSVRYTDVYRQMNKVGVSDREAHKLMDDIRSAKKSEAESADTAKKRVLLESDINEDGKLVMYLGLLAGDNQEEVEKKRDKMAVAVAAGASIDDWLEFEVKVSGKKTRAEKLKVIDGMDLTWEQKDAFYAAAGLSEKTLDETPWYIERYRLPAP